MNARSDDRDSTWADDMESNQVGAVLNSNNPPVPTALSVASTPASSIRLSHEAVLHVDEMARTHQSLSPGCANTRLCSLPCVKQSFPCWQRGRGLNLAAKVPDDMAAQSIETGMLSCSSVFIAVDTDSAGVWAQSSSPG